MTPSNKTPHTSPGTPPSTPSGTPAGTPSGTPRGSSPQRPRSAGAASGDGTSKKANRQAGRDKVAALRRAQQAKERRRILIIWGTATLAVLAIAGAVTFSIVQQQANTPTLDAVQSFTVKQGHVSTAVSYAQSPPAGGEHHPVWLNCGTYPTPVRNENAVHSMEHGAVWVTYRPDLPAGQVAQLTAAVPSTYTVLSPYPGLPAPVVASAWGKQLSLTGPDDPRLAAFIRAYRQGPQSPEAGAACTGGTDATTSSGGNAPGPAGPAGPAGPST